MNTAEDAEFIERRTDLVVFRLKARSHKIDSLRTQRPLPFSFLSPPVADFLEALAAGVFEEANSMAGVLKLVDVGPDLGLPSRFMGSGFPTGGAASMKGHRSAFRRVRNGSRQFDENAANLLNFLVRTQHMLITQQVTETEFPRLNLRLGTSVERAILGPQLFGRVARHPEDFFVGHRWFRPESRESRLVDRARPWEIATVRAIPMPHQNPVNHWHD